MNILETVKENFNMNNITKFLTGGFGTNGAKNSLSDIDAIFIDLPFKTFQNSVVRGIEVTSRRTQAGAEDNDHRYEKSKEVSLEIVFTNEIMANTNSPFLGSLSGQFNVVSSLLETEKESNTKDSYLTFLEYFNTKKKGTLVLMKKNRIFENMTIVSLDETEVHEDDGISKVVNATFKEIRVGTNLNNLEEPAEDTTEEAGNTSQSTGVTSTTQIENVYR